MAWTWTTLPSHIPHQNSSHSPTGGATIQNTASISTAQYLNYKQVRILISGLSHRITFQQPSTRRKNTSQYQHKPCSSSTSVWIDLGLDWFLRWEADDKAPRPWTQPCNGTLHDPRPRVWSPWRRNWYRNISLIRRCLLYVPQVKAKMSSSEVNWSKIRH